MSNFNKNILNVDIYFDVFIKKFGGFALNTKYTPLLMTGLLSAIVWIFDSLLMVYSNSEMSVVAALITGVPVIRLIIRLLIVAILMSLGMAIYQSRNEKTRTFNTPTEPLGAWQKELNFAADIKEIKILETEKSSAKHNDIQDILEARMQELNSAKYNIEPTSEPQVEVSKVVVEDFNITHEPINNDFWGKDRESNLHQPVERKTRKKINLTGVFAGFFAPKVKQGHSDISSDPLNGETLWFYASKLTDALHLTPSETKAVAIACHTYNIGYAGVSDYEDYRNNPTLSCSEAAHAEIGAQILEAVPELAIAGNIVRTHHEKFDGSGPLALQDTEIPLGSRIFSVAWVYHALTRIDGGYRLKNADALSSLYHYGGTALDPELVALFINLMGKRKFYVEAEAENVLA